MSKNTLVGLILNRFYMECNKKKAKNRKFWPYWANRGQKSLIFALKYLYQ